MIQPTLNFVNCCKGAVEIVIILTVPDHLTADTTSLTLSEPMNNRKLIQVDDESDSGGHDISVVTYNILADFHLQLSLSKGNSTYKNCSQEIVTPKQDRNCARHKVLLTEVKM